jgi:hypothetical protein
VWGSEFVISALNGGDWSASRSGRFIPEERTPYIFHIAGWVGLCGEEMTLLHLSLIQPRFLCRARSLVSIPTELSQQHGVSMWTSLNWFRTRYGCRYCENGSVCHMEHLSDYQLLEGSNPWRYLIQVVSNFALMRSPHKIISLPFPHDVQR